MPLPYPTTFALNFHNSLTHKYQRVVAGGGIEQLSARFSKSKIRDSSNNCKQLFHYPDEPLPTHSLKVY